MIYGRNINGRTSPEILQRTTERLHGLHMWKSVGGKRFCGLKIRLWHVAYYDHREKNMFGTIPNVHHLIWKPCWSHPFRFCQSEQCSFLQIICFRALLEPPFQIWRDDTYATMHSSCEQVTVRLAVILVLREIPLRMLDLKSFKSI